MKRPKIAQQPAAGKQPKTAVDPLDAVKHDPLSWGFKWLDFGGEWGWRNLAPEHLEDLRGELREFEGERLKDLLDEHRAKDIPAKHLCRDARKRLKGLRLEERDTLWELRLARKRRVWGLVEGAVFQLLWWDEKETVCNPPPKGTRKR